MSINHPDLYKDYKPSKFGFLKRLTIVELLTILCIGFLISIPFLYSLGHLYPGWYNEYTITISERDQVIGNRSPSVTGYVEELGRKETFYIKDDWLLLHWRSNDIYRNMEVDETYKISTYGFRNRFLSSYENIIGFWPAN